MPLSPVDPAFTAIKKLEKEINKLKREIKQFKETNDVVIDSLEDELLLMQRFIAKESIINAANRCIQTVRVLKNQNVKDEVERKLIVEYMSAKSKIDISETPLEIASDFQSKCFEKVHKLGLHFLNDPL